MGLIFDIQRCCIHDGPGIRTVVFFKGCPLDCDWCHNPESKSSTRQLMYTPTLCIGCGACIEACELGAHGLFDGVHVIDRARCKLCFSCVDVCPGMAMEIAGREVSPAEVMAEVEKDRVFYEESGGGMTLSGGEPVAQFEFAREVLSLAKSAGINTCVETCGFGTPERFEKLVPLVDLFLWDLKHTDEDRHRALTGAPLETILENLRQADAAGAQTILRCVMIPGENLNEAHLDRIAEVYRGLANCRGVELLPYHPLGESKLLRLGLPCPNDKWRQPSDDEMTGAGVYLLEQWNIGTPVL